MRFLTFAALLYVALMSVGHLKLFLKFCAKQVGTDVICHSGLPSVISSLSNRTLSEHGGVQSSHQLGVVVVIPAAVVMRVVRPGGIWQSAGLLVVP
jgi:hypothetical protein